VPSRDEWLTLTDSLGGFGNPSPTAAKMRSISGWNSPTSAANNVSGFSGLPGGIRTVDNFHELGTLGRWYNDLFLDSSYIDALVVGTEQIDGLSVRCKMD
jgi:uncharacterized protein (TIGR02145 family)